MVHESSHNDDNLFVPLDTGAGPAVPLPADRAEALARAVVRRVRDQKPRRRWRVSRPMQMAAAAAMALTMAGVAAAAVRYFAPPKPETIATPQPKAVEPPPKTMRPAHVRRTKPRVEVTEDAPEVVAEPTFDPGVLLHRANRLRAEGHYQLAANLYSRVARDGKGQDAYVATVAAADLRLEHLGAPREALRMYRHALRIEPQGALSAAARYGIAASLRALGDRDAEINALQDLIEHHPSHMLRARADARLAELQ